MSVAAKTPQALLHRQERAYSDHADIWRIGEGETYPHRVGVYLKCHFRTEPAVNVPTGGGRVQPTQHTFRSAAGDDVRDGDFVVNVQMDPRDESKTGILYGRVFRVQGEPEIVVGQGGRVNTLTAILTRIPLPPDWVKREYPITGAAKE